MFPEHGPTGHALLRASDAALYQAKAAGRDAVMVNRGGLFVLASSNRAPFTQRELTPRHVTTGSRLYYDGAMPKLTFHGAARTVTGSKHLLEVDGRRILVDCGQFQGRKDLRLLNWTEFPFDPKALDAVVLTHAHIDHSGLLPRLVAAGYKGRIYCTAGTLELCGVVLPDAGRIQEEDARQANRHGYTKHKPAEPLFTEADAVRTLTQLQPFGFDRSIDLGGGVSCDFQPAGHLLGSAYVRMRTPQGTIIFGGDLGRYDRPVLRDPKAATEADVLILEWTYGDRLHPADDDGERLAEVIRTTIDRRGKVIVPSFAIGRVEEVLYWVKRLEEEGRIPVVPVYVDSPMAQEALNFYARRTDELDDEMSQRGKAMRMFATKRLAVTRSSQESKQVTASRLPSIVISASGMATGGRVLHHLEDGLPNPRNTGILRRLPVGRHARATARGWRQGNQDPRPDHRRERHRRPPGRHVRACGSRRDPALAARVHSPAEDHVPGPRRSAGDGGAQGADHERPAVAGRDPQMHETVEVLG